jgi:transmembrane sensor
MDIGKYISLQEKKRRGTLSPTEAIALQQIENTPAANELEKVRQWSGRYRQRLEPDTEAGWLRLRARMDAAATPAKAKSHLKPIRQRLLAVAAVLLLGIVAVALLRHSARLTSSMLVYETYNGETRELTLSDGTFVHLNENSRIAIPRSFEGQPERQVELSGEAFFNVKTVDNQRFVVQTPNISIIVLGTAFDVRTYSQETFAEVEVQHGKVQLIASSSQETIQLGTGETGVLKGNRLSKKAAAAPNAQSWRTNQLLFNGTPLEEVIPYLERHYKISIDISDPSMRKCRFSANFEQTHLSDVLQTLELALGTTVDRRINGHYVLGSGTCKR